MPGSAHNDLWPELPYEAWKDTRETLHLWTQIAGKIRLALTPWLNHSWHVPLYVTARGLNTSPIPYAEGAFEIEFDFNSHLLRIMTGDGRERRIPLQSRSVAEFYELVMWDLNHLQIPVKITELPSEIPGAILFSQDHTIAPTTQPMRTAFGAPWFRLTGFSSSSAPASSARPARFISFGAASIWP